MNRRSTWLLVIAICAGHAPLRAQGQSGSGSPDPSTFRLVSGFAAEKILDVPAEMGSWVSLATTPDGLIASDQYGKLHRIRPNPEGAAGVAAVTTIPVELGHAQGLCWAFDALYVVAHRMNDATPAGLYRVSDRDGNGELDHVELLRNIDGDGEHGPHAVIAGPDGNSLFVCSGNHTRLVDIARSRVPRNWQEDNLLPRMNDPGGHAVGVLATGGWICRTDRDGREFELVSSGYRNQYDIAFDRNGELFTFDADMEWDIGTPWYRPTRVCHATSGSEFGWRNGDAKWPAYFPDSLPAVVDIGPGSPTGVMFGTGARFPRHYQEALFIADWSFGFIHAVHLQPHGASYRAEVEPFCSAAALQVTDMVVHSDGAMYFTIGGRRTPSALYRITAEAPESPREQIDAPTTEARLRHRLESFHLTGCANHLDEVWNCLAHEDRFIRYAARIAIEQTPLEMWKDRALQETDRQSALETALALVRCLPPGPEAQELLLGLLESRFPWEQLDENARIHLLRIASLIATRHGPLSDSSRQRMHAMWSERLPDSSVLVSRELARILAATDAPGMVDKALSLMEGSQTQEDQIHYAKCLRAVRNGWTPESQRRYLEWFRSAAAMQGGSSFQGYLRTIRQEFIAGLSGESLAMLGDLATTVVEETDPYLELRARPVVKKWTLADLLPALNSVEWETRDLENGRQVFVQAQCFKCHQFQGSGGSVGPDLSGLHRRYTTEYLLETIVDPDKAISDQYQATVFELADGRMLTGRVANLTGEELLVQTDMIAPGKLTRISRNEIEDMRPSKTSPMPVGLVDSFREEDILDLMAFLRSGEVDGAAGR